MKDYCTFCSVYSYHCAVWCDVMCMSDSDSELESTVMWDAMQRLSDLTITIDRFSVLFQALCDSLLFIVECKGLFSRAVVEYRLVFLTFLVINRFVFLIIIIIKLGMFVFIYKGLVFLVLRFIFIRLDFPGFNSKEFPWGTWNRWIITVITIVKIF